MDLLVMKKENPVISKSYLFAVSIVSLYNELQLKKEYVLARQILPSGTSIGANVEEAIGARSRKDLLNKITIAYKEARETNYWLRLLRDTGCITETRSKKLIDDTHELLKLLGSIQITVKKDPP